MTTRLLLMFTVGVSCARADAAEPSPFVSKLVDPVLLRGIEEVYLDGDYAYLPCREGKRLTVCSIKDPARPFIVSSFTHPDLEEAAGLAINGSHLYLTSLNNQRLLILDAQDKSRLRLLGSAAVGKDAGKGLLYKVAYRDGYCFVTSQTEKSLIAVDVRNPATPKVVSRIAVTRDNDGPFSVLLRDKYALVGTLFGSKNRLAVVDISDPANLRLVTQVFDKDLSQVSGTVVGNLYYSVAWDRNTLLVFDISDPAQPKLRSKFVDRRLGEPNRLVIHGKLAYLPMIQGGGIAIVDISDSSAPKFRTALRDPVMTRAYGAAVRGDMLFVGSRGGNSLVVLDTRVLEKIPINIPVKPAFNAPAWQKVAQLVRGRIDALTLWPDGGVMAGSRAGDPGRIWRSDDAGATWLDLGRPISSEILCLAWYRDHTVFASTIDGHVWRTDDLGKSWADLGKISSQRIYGLVVTRKGTLLASNFDEKGGHLYRSADAGKSWQDLGKISTRELYRFEKLADDILIVNGSAGHIYRSSDDGKTWVDRGQLSQAPLYATEYLGDGMALQGDDQGVIFQSRDNGLTWQRIAKVPDACDDFAWLGNGVVLLSTYLGRKHTYLSKDHGRTWADLGPLPGNDVVDHMVRVEHRNVSKIIGGTTSGEIWRWQLP